MLDIKFIIENKEAIEHSIKSREIDVDLKLLLKKYDEFRKVKKLLDDSRRRRNVLSQEINALKKKKKSIRSPMPHSLFSRKIFSKLKREKKRSTISIGERFLKKSSKN